MSPWGHRAPELFVATTSGPAVRWGMCGRRHPRVTESLRWVQPFSRVLGSLALCPFSGVSSPESCCPRPDVL
eukprot:10709628-Alexandrium_andersonii.AAC.1